MTEKTEAQTMVLKAERLSTQAVDEWRRAFRSLDGDVGLNGYGVIRDPDQLRAKLLGAREHIENSLKYLAELKVPTNADYDRAEGGA